MIESIARVPKRCSKLAGSFCKSADEDAMRVVACLQANRAKIGEACNQVLVSQGQ